MPKYLKALNETKKNCLKLLFPKIPELNDGFGFRV